MEKDNVLKIVKESATLDDTKLMMGTTAYHQLGDISSDVYDWFYAHSETLDYYVGQWVTGLGFVNVVYPKNTTRELTDDELKHFKTLKFSIGSMFS